MARKHLSPEHLAFDPTLKRQVEQLSGRLRQEVRNRLWIRSLFSLTHRRANVRADLHRSVVPPWKH